MSATLKRVIRGEGGFLLSTHYFWGLLPMIVLKNKQLLHFYMKRDNELAVVFVVVFANVWPIAKSPLLDLQVRLDCKKISEPHTTRPGEEKCNDFATQ